MKCSRCGKGPLDGVTTDTYYGASGALVLCDPCLFADLHRDDPQPNAAPAPISEALDEELRLHGAAAFAEYA